MHLHHRPLLALLLAAGVAYAGEQVIVSAPSGNPTSTSEYTIMGASIANGAAGLVHRCLMPTSGRARRMRVHLNNAPGAAASGRSRTQTLYINGSATALAVTVLETATTNTDTEDAVVFAAGDMLNLTASVSGAPTASTVSTSIVVDLPTESLVLCGGTGATAPAVAVDAIPLMGDATLSGADGLARIYMPIGGTATTIYAYCATTPGGGETITAELMLDATATSLTCNWTSASGTPTGFGCTAAVSEDVDIGDLPWVRLTNSGGSNLGRCWASILLDTDEPGQGMWATGWDQTITAAGAEYVAVLGAADRTNTVENQVDSPPQAKAIVRDLYCSCATGNPTIFDTVVCTLRSDVGDTALSCTMSGMGDSACEETGESIEVIEVDLLDTYIDLSAGFVLGNRCTASYAVDFKRGGRRWVSGE